MQDLFVPKTKPLYCLLIIEDLRPLWYPSVPFVFNLGVLFYSKCIIAFVFSCLHIQRNTSKMTGLVLVSQSVVVHMSEKRLTIDNWLGDLLVRDQNLSFLTAFPSNCPTHTPTHVQIDPIAIFQGCFSSYSGLYETFIFRTGRKVDAESEQLWLRTWNGPFRLLMLGLRSPFDGRTKFSKMFQPRSMHPIHRLAWIFLSPYQKHSFNWQDWLTRKSFDLDLKYKNSEFAFKDVVRS